MRYCVYCHTNKINGKKYIGITSQNPEKRWRNGDGYKNNKYFYRSIKKYGWHNFFHEILYVDLRKEDAERLEIKLIAEYETTNNEKGYNIEAGGNGTEKFTDDIKSKISASLKGHICSDETKKKISIANKGRLRRKGYKMSEKAIEINRRSHIGQRPWNLGKKWSAEEKARFGGKKVRCVELNKIYLTAHEASADLGIDVSSICKCRKGKVKTAGGYHWEEVGDLPE